MVAAIVVALFFALVVLEKRELFAALKALGTSTARLGRDVILQALIASVIGVIFGAIASRLLGLIAPETVPTLFRTDTLINIAIFGAFVLATLLGCMNAGNVAKVQQAPVTVIVGMDLEFHHRLPQLFPHVDARAWFEGKPLFDWRVIAPRTKDDLTSLIEELAHYGAGTELVATMSIEPPRTEQGMELSLIHI